ncbi:hypothetical protein [Rubrivivax rivuli]|uniref:Uncharacterized protein n=1 Tax=Rubrivivax rivuli TaxID=1862385 RepID=A0A437RIT4_9BURK|nr:hypothetical protein [Rubrivivax rivuli]RVU46588.1 hypothetical protein EOE66_12335 [Rubrivivax rivuli]
MKSLSATLAILAALITATAAQGADVDVGVSIAISQPGVYGRIDIGRFPQPQVIVAQPIIVQRPVQDVRVQPVYLWVPPGHRKDWKKHCRDYNACGVPVYFVRHDWYDQQVRRGGRDRDDDDHRGHSKGKGQGQDKHHDKGDRGHGKGKDRD